MSQLFTDTEYDGKTFESLEARGQSFRGLIFEGSTFVGCSFAEATFLSCRFLDCTFQKCDFSNAQLTGTSFRSVRGEDSKFLGVNWAQAASLSDLSFLRSVLNYGNFGGLDLRRFRFEECVARELELTDANLAESQWRGTDLKGSRFARTNLTKADFRGATNYTIRPLENKLKGAKFSLPEATLLLYGLDIVITE